MTSNPDSDGKALAAALFADHDDDTDHSAEQPAARRVRLTEDTSSNPVLGEDDALLLVRRLFTPTAPTDEGASL